VALIVIQPHPRRCHYPNGRILDPPRPHLKPSGRGSWSATISGHLWRTPGVGRCRHQVLWSQYTGQPDLTFKIPGSALW